MNIRILFLLIPVVFACEKELPIEINSLPKALVIYGILNTDSVPKIILKHTQNVNHVGLTDQTAVTDAFVKIYSENTKVYPMMYFPYRDNRDGAHYKVTENMKPIPGEKYTIEAYSPGMQTVRSQIQIPKQIDLFKAKFSNQHSPATTGNPYTYMAYIPIRLGFTDPPEENYYDIRVINLRYIDQPQIPSPLFEDFPVYSYDQIFASQESNNIINNEELYPLMPFSDKLFNGRNVSIEILFKVPLNQYQLISNYDFSNLYIELRHISKEYYLFEQSFQNYDNANALGVYPITEPVNVFTNIENGFGIFAGYSSSKIKLDTKNPDDYELSR